MLVDIDCGTTPLVTVFRAARDPVTKVFVFLFSKQFVTNINNVAIQVLQQSLGTTYE
jgi:hypothetical protein